MTDKGSGGASSADAGDTMLQSLRERLADAQKREALLKERADAAYAEWREALREMNAYKNLVAVEETAHANR